MKMLLAVWIMVSSAGLTHSFLAERSRRLLSMKDMAEGLRRLGFYISRWQLPMEEAFAMMEKEGESVLSDFYGKVAKEVKERRISDLGELWRKESCAYLKQFQLPGQVLEIWCSAFLDVAPLSQEEERRLSLRAGQLEKICGELEEKYRQESRPLMAAGVCAGAVFCLLMW